MADQPQSVGPIPSAPTMGPVSKLKPYNYSNYVVGGLYVLLILWSIWNLRTHLKSRLLIDAPKLLFGHVIAWGFVRALFAFFPNSVWTKVADNNVRQVFLDLLPELLYLFIFSLLIAMWTNVFARSRHLRLRKPENILWATHAVLCSLLVIGASVLLIYCLVYDKKKIPRSYSKYRKWESYWMVASAVIILFGTILFGIGVARSLSKMQLISDFLKRQARKVRLLLIVTLLAIILKTVYNLVIAQHVNAWYQKDRDRNGGAHAAIVFFYFFLTDIVPIAVILTAFVRPGQKKKTSSGREYVPYSEDEVESSDGLLSNEEAY